MPRRLPPPADVVILVDRIDRVAAVFGWLTPVEGALTQEAIDVAVILRALRPGQVRRRGRLPQGRLAKLKAEHAEIDHLVRRLSALSEATGRAGADRRTIEESHWVIQTIVSPCRIHNAQEDDLYEQAAAT